MELIVDWKKLIADLMASGMTQRAIADELGVSQGTISQILSGLIASMEWSKGEKLRELHKARIAEQPAAA